MRLVSFTNNLSLMQLILGVFSFVVQSLLVKNIFFSFVSNLEDLERDKEEL